MIELKRVADSLMEGIETEYDCPSLHPELGNKVPVLDLAMWVEEVRVSAQGMEGQEMHSRCSEGSTCLPLGGGGKAARACRRDGGGAWSYQLAGTAGRV